jgi:hypothetical protein
MCGEILMVQINRLALQQRLMTDTAVRTFADTLGRHTVNAVAMGADNVP